MHAWVALIHRHRVLPMPRLDTRKPLGHQGKGFIPANRLPFAAHPPHGLVQAVRVILDVLQGHRLGADVAATETVQRVALDRGDRQATVFGLGGFQGEAADGFAQVAGTVVESLGHGQSLL